MSKRYKTTNRTVTDEPASLVYSIPNEEIAACAYGIWLQEGCPEGHAIEHWLQAEAQLRLSRSHSLKQPEPAAAARISA